MNADKNKQDGSFPEADEVYKAAAPRQSAARKRVSPRPAWLAERPEVRVRKDLAAFFEFFTPLHFCVAHPQYDAKQPFDTTCEPIASRTDAEIQECGFTGPRGGRVNFILVKPRRAKPPYPGVIFQHGGGQSMTNYLSEALILARAGVISIIPGAPARGEGKNSELNTIETGGGQRLSGGNRDHGAACTGLASSAARYRPEANRLCRPQLWWHCRRCAGRR